MDLERRNQIFKQMKRTYEGHVELGISITTSIDPDDLNYEAYKTYKEDFNNSKYFAVDDPKEKKQPIEYNK